MLKGECTVRSTLKTVCTISLVHYSERCNISKESCMKVYDRPTSDFLYVLDRMWATRVSPLPFVSTPLYRLVCISLPMKGKYRGYRWWWGAPPSVEWHTWLSASMNKGRCSSYIVGNGHPRFTGPWGGFIVKKFLPALSLTLPIEPSLNL